MRSHAEPLELFEPSELFLAAGATGEASSKSSVNEESHASDRCCCCWGCGGGVVGLRYDVQADCVGTSGAFCSGSGSLYRWFVFSYCAADSHASLICSRASGLPPSSVAPWAPPLCKSARSLGSASISRRCRMKFAPWKTGSPRTQRVP